MKPNMKSWGRTDFDKIDYAFEVCV